MDKLNDPPAALDAVAAAVLREVARMLAALARGPAFADAIDLHSLPLSEAARAGLRARLGQGEVEVALVLAGPTSITETAYAGVWWLRHADADDRALVEQIVVARVPALLLAHPVDIADAAQRLDAELAARSRGPKLATRTRQETVHD